MRGCLKLIPVSRETGIYHLAGIESPNIIRRQIAGEIEWTKQISDERYHIYITTLKRFSLCQKKPYNPQRY